MGAVSVRAQVVFLSERLSERDPRYLLGAVILCQLFSGKSGPLQADAGCRAAASEHW